MANGRPAYEACSSWGRRAETTPLPKNAASRRGILIARAARRLREANIALRGVQWPDRSIEPETAAQVPTDLGRVLADAQWVRRRVVEMKAEIIALPGVAHALRNQLAGLEDTEGVARTIEGIEQAAIKARLERRRASDEDAAPAPAEAAKTTVAALAPKGGA